MNAQQRKKYNAAVLELALINKNINDLQNSGGECPVTIPIDITIKQENILFDKYDLEDIDATD